MRFAALATLLAAASLIFVGTCFAQDQQDQAPAPPPQNQQSTPMQRQAQSDGWQMHNRMMGRGTGMMNPRITVRSEHMNAREGLGGPLHIFSELESDLDNPRIRATLGLTTQQVDSLRSLLVDTEIHTIQTGAGMAVDGIQLKELLRSDHPDRAAVMAKGTAISQSVSQLVDQYLDALLKAKTILTPQQQDMIRRYMAMRGQGMGGFDLGGPGMGGPSPEDQRQ